MVSEKKIFEVFTIISLWELMTSPNHPNPTVEKLPNKTPHFFIIVMDGIKQTLCEVSNICRIQYMPTDGLGHMDGCSDGQKDG